jgi:nitrite reductase (cytochrome c-552)
MSFRLAHGLVLGIALGLVVGIGAYTFVYARGYSYMTDNADACVNCHIMQDQYSGWVKSSHRAVAVCNDCHTPLPYKREGALKISDHHVRSPLLNINRACQTCHKWSEEELKARVETIQGRTHSLRNIAMDALVDLVNDIKAARAAGVDSQKLSAAQDFQRRAQFYVDFIESENSNGFHAPQEATRILGESINFSRKGQIALR